MTNSLGYTVTAESEGEKNLKSGQLCLSYGQLSRPTGSFFFMKHGVVLS